jgi:hypothetical protein
LAGQTSFLLEEADGPEDPGIQANSGAAPNGPLDGPVLSVATVPASEVDPGSRSGPPTSKLLSAARRVRDYQREGQGATRQLDIPLRHTPPPGIFFQLWPNPADDFEVAILRVKDDSDRTDVYPLTPEIADLPFISPKVKDGRLIAGITSTGSIFVWAATDPDPADRMAYRTHSALYRVAQMARGAWVSIHWLYGKVLVHDPPAELVEEQPHWPTGQSLQEILELAVADRLISHPNHPVIRNLNTRSREA